MSYDVRDYKAYQAVYAGHLASRNAEVGSYSRCNLMPRVWEKLGWTTADC